MDIEEVLKSIRPTENIEVMDIVEAAGISVAAWRSRKDGGAVQNPRANPAYVYEWAFGGESEPTLLCIWHRDLAIIEGRITREDCVRDYALQLDRKAIDQRAPAEVKSRARTHAKRARTFDSMVQRAYRNRQPVRVVLLEGEHKDEAELGLASSKVEKRLLDTDRWYVHEYEDEDGRFRLVRSFPPKGSAQAIPVALPPLAVLDALDDIGVPPIGNFSPMRLEGSGLGFQRDEAVRAFVLARARGLCEYCGALGFLLPDGRRYVETHHLIWLAKGGPDTLDNVIALCANHHREAHFGLEREMLEEKLFARLKRLRNT